MKTDATRMRLTKSTVALPQWMRHLGQPIVAAILLIIVNRGLFCGASAAAAEPLMLFPQALGEGQWWRLFTYPLVHLSLYHLLLDGGAFLILLHGLQERRMGIRFFYCLCASAGSLLASWIWSPQLWEIGLTGLSGIAHGLMAISSLEMLRTPGMRKWGFLSLLLVVVKSGYELASGAVFFEFMHWGLCGHPIAASHAGGVAGALVGYGTWHCLAAALRATLWPMLQHCLRVIVHGLYRIRHDNLDQIPRRGAAVLVSNHVSYIDALILIAACRRPIRFVMHTKFYHLPFLGWLFKLAGAIPIDSAKRNPALLRRALDLISSALERGELVGLFPEGCLTRTGQMSPFRPGIERIIQRNPVPVVPVALKGLWGSIFSHQRQSHRKHRGWRNPVEVAVGRQVPAPLVSAGTLFERVATLRGNHA